jgi:hypothetical protein
MLQTVAHTANSIKNYELGITSTSQSVAFSIKNYELGITSTSQSVAFSIKNYEVGITSASQSVAFSITNYELGITSTSQSAAVRRARILQNSKIQNSKISLHSLHFSKKQVPLAPKFSGRGFLFVAASAHTKNHIIYRSGSHINPIHYTNYAELHGFTRS